MTNPKTTKRARDLRTTATKSEGLLWSILRGKQICGLKFRQQHPIGPFIADFACVSHKLVIEIDGPSHDITIAADLSREGYLRSQGWTIIRFDNDDAKEDPEAVAKAIAIHLGLKYEFRRRMNTGSGLENVRAPKHRAGNQIKPSPEQVPTLPEGG